MTLAAGFAGGIAALDVGVDPAAQATLLDYVALLEKWNRTYNLTAIRQRARIVTHHLLDSLAVLPHLPQSASLRLIDIGSGAGLPGIPIAVARPAWHLALLDSNEKKTAFLRQAVAELGLGNVEVVAKRAEQYEPPRPFDAAISRAYSDVSAFATHARRLTGPGGRWFAMKGAYPAAELAQLPRDVLVTRVAQLEVPGVRAQRHLVAMEAA